MIAKSGDRLLDDEALAAMKTELVAQAFLVTPNIPEAEALTNIEVRTDEDRKEAARRIVEMGASAVVIKGGHLPSDDITDLLLHEGEFVEFRQPRVRGPPYARHGMHVRRGDHVSSGEGPRPARGSPGRAAVCRRGDSPRAGTRSRARTAGALLQVQRSKFEVIARNRTCSVAILNCMPLIAVTPAALDLQALTQEVTGSRAGDGAVASFIGLVRDHNQGRRVSFLDYEAYEPLAVRALGRIADESRPGVARHASWRASPDGPHRDRRSERHHRGGVASSRQRVCRVPVHDRANQADRPHLEARALRGRRRLAGGRHSGSRR